MFDLQNQSLISLEDMTMMLMNLPDLGFSSGQNIYAADKFYLDIRDSVVKCVH